MSRSKCYDKGSQDVPAWQGSPVLCGGDAAGDSEYQHLQPPPPPNAGDHGCVPLAPLHPPWPEEPLGCPELMREERSQPPLLFSIMLSSITSPDPANTSPPGALPQLSLKKMVESLKGLRSSYRKTFQDGPSSHPIG